MENLNNFVMEIHAPIIIYNIVTVYGHYKEN